MENASHPIKNTDPSNQVFKMFGDTLNIVFVNYFNAPVFSPEETLQSFEYKSQVDACFIGIKAKWEDFSRNELILDKCTLANFLEVIHTCMIKHSAAAPAYNNQLLPLVNFVRGIVEKVSHYKSER